MSVSAHEQLACSDIRFDNRSQPYQRRSVCHSPFPWLKIHAFPSLKDASLKGSSIVRVTLILKERRCLNKEIAVKHNKLGIDNRRLVCLRVLVWLVPAAPYRSTD